MIVFCSHPYCFPHFSNTCWCDWILLVKIRQQQTCYMNYIYIIYIYIYIYEGVLKGLCDFWCWRILASEMQLQQHWWKKCKKQGGVYSENKPHLAAFHENIFVSRWNFHSTLRYQYIYTHTHTHIYIYIYIAR